MSSTSRRLRALRRRIGRRGAALLAWAFVDAVIGYSLLDPASRPRGQLALTSYRAILSVAPFRVWGWLWISVAVICLVGAFGGRWDAYAFGAAIGIKLVWAGGLLTGWAAYHAYRGWVAAATWLVLAALVSVIAGWPEPRRRKPPDITGPDAADPGMGLLGGPR